MDTQPFGNKQIVRRFPVGAEVQPGGVHFRVWAPGHRKAMVVFEPGGDALPLLGEGNGYFSAFAASARAGTMYRFRFDGGMGVPDPVSRFQPEGPHGPSMVIDASFPWTDGKWTGYAPDEHIIYEMHIGTFTPEGSWKAAERQLPELRALGVTTIELMPIADFAGDRGWGYDGVNMYAPTRNYGTPEDLRRFVNRAHEEGLAVILDVVYNHMGPDGNYLDEVTPDYFGSKHTEWGRSFNADGDNNGPVRDFMTENAAYWIEDFHLDGLRLDATHQLFDDSPVHIIADIASAAREAAPSRHIFIVAENETQDSRLIRARDGGGYGVDALYNDDFHHAAVVAASGRREAYYSDYLGAPQEFVSLAKHGFLYQGQFDKWQRQRRGHPSFDRPLRQFVVGLENHDQVANSGRGQRVSQMTSPGRLRALTALMLLLPQIPMIFQGQEFGASTGFHYFADHAPDLAAAVRDGRLKFLSQFPSAAVPEMASVIADPGDVATFEKSKLNFAERETHAPLYRMHKELIRLRRDDLAFRRAAAIDGAVLGPEAFVIRYISDGEDRLLLVNFGLDLIISPAPEPLLAPPDGRAWEMIWSSEDPDYGGCGTPQCESAAGWKLPGHAAVVLKARQT